MTSLKSQRLRVGVTGGGLVAQLAHLPVLSAMPDAFDVVALAEPSATVRAALAARWRIPFAFAGHREMLASRELDAVIVCSPNESHAQITLDAVAAGLAVLVEKPLCLAPADADSIAHAARRSGTLVRVGYMKQFDEALSQFMELLPRHGRLLRVECSTVDNAIARRFRPHELVVSDDLPAEFLRASAAALEEQVADALAEPVTVQDARAYSLAFCGALVHDVNLTLNVFEQMDVSVTGIADAAGAMDATWACGTYNLASGVRWSASWLLAPHAPRFAERLRFFFDDGERTLSLPAPYADVHGTYAAQLRHFHTSVISGDTSTWSLDQGVRDVSLLARTYRHVLGRREVRAA